MKIYKVSMPLVGLIPFLLMARRRPHNGTRVCQCPWSGLSHFYKRFYLTLVFVLAVSMPLVGLIPFLLDEPVEFAKLYKGVNALGRAYPISTMNNMNNNTQNTTVSMPLVGLIPFLPRQVPGEIQCQCVSMPLVGLIPFLLIEMKFRLLLQIWCQCPWSGLSHFYGIPSKTL